MSKVKKVILCYKRAGNAPHEYNTLEIIIVGATYAQGSHVQNYITGCTSVPGVNVFSKDVVEQTYIAGMNSKVFTFPSLNEWVTANDVRENLAMIAIRLCMVKSWVDSLKAIDVTHEIEFC